MVTEFHQSSSAIKIHRKAILHYTTTSDIPYKTVKIVGSKRDALSTQ